MGRNPDGTPRNLTVPTHVPWTGGIMGVRVDHSVKWQSARQESVPPPRAQGRRRCVLMLRLRTPREPLASPVLSVPGVQTACFATPPRWETGLDGMKSSAGAAVVMWRAWESKEMNLARGVPCEQMGLPAGCNKKEG